ncbi:MAG: response regulator transcription factor [Pygmaiobacter sp.]|nr:response regulator transcription factor [Pygmaiobacter sp.]
MAQILAIDDDKEILLLIQTALQRDGHRVEIASDTGQATLAKAKMAELILLDVMMPSEDGFAYCARIRDEVDCPILFLTARTSESDLVHGLDLGADDYIAKPFTVTQLRARVAAHLRRQARPRTHTLHTGAACADLAARQLLIAGQPVPLTKSEYDICTKLMAYAGQVFSKEQLYEAVFGLEGETDNSVIVEHIKNIRAKLKLFGQEPIETVWGIGYRWKRE